MRNVSHVRWTGRFVAVLLLTLAICFTTPPLLGWWNLRAGKQALESRRPTEALRAFDRAYNWSGESAALAFWKGRAYRKLGQMDQVRQSLERARALGFDHSLLRREEILAEAQSGQLRRSMPELPRLLVEAGSDADEVCEAFAEGLVMHHRFPEAYTLLDAWEKDFPDDPRPHAYRAAISASGANWDDARQHWSRACQQAPEEPEYLLGVAETCYQLNDIHSTLKTLDAYERQMGDRAHAPRADLLRAKALLQQGEFRSAREILTPLTGQPAIAAEVTLLLCRIALESGETTGLAEKLQSIVQAEPWNTDARHLLVRTWTILGNTAGAEEQQSALLALTRDQQMMQNLLEEVRKDPRDVERRFQVAELAARCGPPDDAIPWLLSVLDLAPQHPGAHRLLAELYQQTGLSHLAQDHQQFAPRPQSDSKRAEFLNNR